jgi:hypothetical protein
VRALRRRRRLEIAPIARLECRRRAESGAQGIERSGNAMKGILIGAAVTVLIVLAGFGALVVMAEGLEPSGEEIRIDVTDQMQD